MIVPVILSGGSGTRLWPLSRELYPKQLLPLVDDRTMLQNTVARIGDFPDAAPPIVVCNESHRFMVAEQLRSMGVKAGAVLLEPVGRNTAPAVAVAALEAVADGSDPILLVLPADHVIVDVDAFHRAVETGILSAREGKLITFGIAPASPETGYGYIKVAGKPAGAGAHPVERFVEKPGPEAAAAYVASGEYFWNSGMFIFTASCYLLELERFAPEMLISCRKAHSAAVRDKDFVRLEAAAFASSPSDSIDYAVMEKTANAAVVPLNAGWSDVGSWSALWNIGKRDEEGNVVRGDVVVHDARNCYFSSENRLLAAVGVDDLVIVETADAILVAHRDRVQNVKAVVRLLNALKRPETIRHRKVFRPWGAYQSVDAAERFQVKRITVNPGASLSLQMHHHRAEHWIVVKGTARVVRGEEEIFLSENQSTYIPLGVTHRLENPGVIPLELIEVQSGSYLGEDDIVRFQDVYGR